MKTARWQRDFSLGRRRHREVPVYGGAEKRLRRRSHLVEAFVRFRRKYLYVITGVESRPCPIRNISRDGVSFRSRRPIRSGQLLSLRFETSSLVHSFPKRFRCLAKVIWADKLANKTYWRVGCEFIRMSKQDIRELSEYIRDSMVVSTKNKREVV